LLIFGVQTNQVSAQVNVQKTGAQPVLQSKLLQPVSGNSSSTQNVTTTHISASQPSVPAQALVAIPAVQAQVQSSTSEQMRQNNQAQREKLEAFKKAQNDAQFTSTQATGSASNFAQTTSSTSEQRTPVIQANASEPVQAKSIDLTTPQAQASPSHLRVAEEESKEEVKK
jgi:hypothetical protein